MKVLIVYSNNKNKISPFVIEQVESLKKYGISFEFFGIQGKGILGYLSNILKYYIKLSKFKPNLIHAHNGHSGLFANLQFFFPVITTFHGSDVHQKNDLKYSKVCALLSKKNIVVNEKMKKLLGVNSLIIPCGVDTNLFDVKSKIEARKRLNLDVEKKYILFASGFENKIKNYPLAKKAVEQLNDNSIEVIEFLNFTREDSALMFNAVDVALLTSFDEGSPQFIKEAMACNKPIVSTNVGDVNYVLGDLEGCFITSFEASDVTEKIKKALMFSKNELQTKGRDRIYEIQYHQDAISSLVYEVYEMVIKNQS